MAAVPVWPDAMLVAEALLRVEVRVLAASGHRRRDGGGGLLIFITRDDDLAGGHRAGLAGCNARGGGTAPAVGPRPCHRRVAGVVGAAAAVGVAGGFLTAADGVRGGFGVIGGGGSGPGAERWRFALARARPPLRRPRPRRRGGRDGLDVRIARFAIVRLLRRGGARVESTARGVTGNLTAAAASSRSRRRRLWRSVDR